VSAQRLNVRRMASRIAFRFAAAVTAGAA